MSPASPQRAAARDELRAKAEFTASTLRIVANDAALEGGESPEWFNLEFLRGAADVILALLAAVERGAGETETVMQEAFMTGRIYASCGERESPMEIQAKLRANCEKAIRRARATPTGADHAESR